MTPVDTMAAVHQPSARPDAAYAAHMDTSLTAGATPREWRLAPGGIVSLWDMLQIHAKVFATLMESLGRIEAAAGLGPPNVDPNSEEGREICRGLWDQAVDPQLEEVASACEVVGLKHLVPHIRRVRKRFNDHAEKWGFSELRQFVMDLGGQIKDGLNDSVFMHVPTSRVDYYSNTNLFGEAVANKFPKLIEDIAEAGKCFACGRFTASVFHLMRVMEGGVEYMAKKLSPMNTGPNWGDMLNSVDAALKNLPGGNSATKKQKDRKEALSRTAAYLHHVKNGWRNPTMHPKLTYTEEEVVTLLGSVRDFMQSLTKPL